MKVQLVVHFDNVDNWWAELSGLPGFTASAESLAELRAVVEDCLPDLTADVGDAVVIVSEVLADPDTDSDPGDRPAFDPQGERQPVPMAWPGTRVRIPVPA